MKITRKELIDSVYRDIGSENTLDKADVAECIYAFIDELKNEIGKGNTIELRGLGTFCLKKRSAKKNARNPKSGKVYDVKEHYIASFRSGAELSSMLRNLPKE